jgi:hypothetical protein
MDQNSHSPGMLQRQVAMGSSMQTIHLQDLDLCFLAKSIDWWGLVSPSVVQIVACIMDLNMHFGMLGNQQNQMDLHLGEDRHLDAPEPVQFCSNS